MENKKNNLKVFAVSVFLLLLSALALNAEERSVEDIERELLELEKQELELELKLLKKKIKQTNKKPSDIVITNTTTTNAISKGSRPIIKKDEDEGEGRVINIESKSLGGGGFFGGYFHLNTKDVLPQENIESRYMNFGGFGYSIVKRILVVGGMGASIMPVKISKTKYLSGGGYGGVLLGARLALGPIDIMPFVVVGGGGYSVSERTFSSISEANIAGSGFFFVEASGLINVVIKEHFAIGLMPFYMYGFNSPIKTWGINLAVQFGKFRENKKDENK